MNFGRLLLRLVVGGLFVGHGTQKLFGWFGGPGLDGATGMMENLELEPARDNAVAASATEAAGGAMIATGTLTPVAAAGLIGAMITAIRKVHLSKGLWNTAGGYEFNLVLLVALFYLAENGPGGLSVDGAFGHGGRSPARGFLALAAGAIGSTAIIERGRRIAESKRSETPPHPPAENADQT